MPRPEISVVIPFLNSGRYLLRSVESVFRQTFKNWEIILVDGGSGDGSQNLARKLARDHPGRIRVFGKKKKYPLGIYQSRILGARRARAPLVALLDSDDEFQSGLLESRAALYRRAFGRASGLVFGPAVFWWEEPSARRRLALQPVPRPGFYKPPSLLPDFLEGNYIKTPCTTGALMSRRILLESARHSKAVGRHMIEDLYLWSDIALRCPIFIDARPLFWYRQRPDSTCARGKARGELEKLRRRHLRWLFGLISAGVR